MRASLLITLLIFLCCLAATGQPNHINITNFTVKNQLPGNINDWINIPGSLLLTAQKLPQTPNYQPGLVIQIKSGSGFVCGNNSGNAVRVDPFTVRNFTAAQLVGYLGQCPILQPGTYSICVQFYDEEKRIVSREVCKEFTVTGQSSECSPPVNISPTNEKVLQ